MRFKILVRVLKHLEACVQEKSSKNIYDPVKSLDQFGSGKDHYHTQAERSHNTPKEHTMLVFLWNFEKCKNEQENEQIID